MMRLIVSSVVSSSCSAPASDNATLSAADVCPSWLECASSPRWPGRSSNHHFEITDFLLGHGADINTHWSSHDPASILHGAGVHKDYKAMQFLIGPAAFDMTIVDYRWGPGLGVSRCKRREDGAVPRRGATAAGACIALRATRRLKPNREHILGEDSLL